MLVDPTQVEEVKTRFTELGSAIAEVSDENADAFDDMLDSIDYFKEAVKELNIEGLENIEETINLIENQKNAISNTFISFAEKSGISLSLFNNTLDDATEKFSLLSNEVTKEVVEQDKVVTEIDFNEEERKLKEEEKKRKERERREKQRKFEKSVIGREVKSLKNSITGMLRKVHLPLPGAILAGGVMWMAFGFQRRDRIQREAGEVTNILITMYDSAVDRMVRSGTNYISKLQENLQQFYGIARQEVQGVAQAFAEGGLTIEQMLSEVDTDIRGVADNYLTLTLGIDKMLELAGGDTARRTITYISEYGKTLGEARDTTLKMISAGMESGIGVQQFTKNVESAAGSLQKFGFDIDDVIDLSMTLQDSFEKMGVPRQFAGRQAAMGLTQMASSIVNMSNEWKMMIGEEMGFGKGLDAIQKMQEAFSRVAEGGRKDELMKFIEKLGGVVLRAAQGDETLAKYILQEASGLKMGVEGSNSIMMVKRAIDEGDIKRAEEIVDKNIKTIQESLQTEKQKQSRFQRNMNEWMQGISKMGEGILSVMGNLLATLIGFFRSVPQMIINYLRGDEEANEILLSKVGDLSSGMDKGFKQMIGGLRDMKGAAERSGKTILGSTFDNLARAIEFDPLGKGEKEQEGQPIAILSSEEIQKLTPEERAEVLPSIYPRLNPVRIRVPHSVPQIGMGSEEVPRMVERYTPTTETIRVVTVPVEVGTEEATYEVPIAESYLETPEGQIRLEEEQWVGGQLSIVSSGTDQLGNINLMLMGNCPRCGLLFGDESAITETRMGMRSYSEVDEEALARMIRSEMGRKPLTGTREIEAAGIGFTALNRLKQGGFGQTLEEVITGGTGFGRQGTTKGGKMRPYATKREATKESRELARKILEGRALDPTGGATYFYHSTLGKGYGPRDPSKRVAMPKFTRGKVNTLNINRASFWGSGGKVTKEATDAAKWREKEEARFIRKQELPPMVQLREIEKERGREKEGEWGGLPSIFTLED